MSELIAFIGIGNMGSPMAENLVKAGKSVKVFDASANMIEKAKEKKLEVTKNLDELITKEVTTVITMLPEGKNSKEVYLGDNGIINKVSKTYGNKEVVRNVSLSIRRGEVVGLLGPNGAGKTTTFYMIVGLVKPDGGSILLDKIDISKTPIYERGLKGSAYLPQEPSIFRGMNVEDNLLSIIEITENDKNKHQIKKQIRIGYVVSKQLGLDSMFTSVDLTKRIPRRKLPI